jgi:hypothetical protein
MLKKPSDLSDKEKIIINNIIFFLLILAIIFMSFRAYSIYQEYGFDSCVIEIDQITKEEELVCFPSSQELDEYLLGKIRTINLDYKYINNHTNIDIVD